MSQFIQLHILTSYAPSNLNRDDLGRPKTAIMGGFERLRISSQSLKRHWRTSELFNIALSGNIGIRTKKFGLQLYDALIEGGVSEKNAKKWVGLIIEQYGKIKKDSIETEQLVHISHLEKSLAFNLINLLIKEQREPTKQELESLKTINTSVDIALFGRMLASAPKYNIEAACQVAHAISVHSTVIEDDYFTAVDDLNNGETDTGSAHIGEAGFAAALFYSYICINKTQLIESLDGNEELANKAIQALTEVAIKVSPTGKQNSFASRAYASYVLAEKGSYQPRSLSVAFLKPIDDEDMENAAINALKFRMENFDKVYGTCAESRYQLNAVQGEGSLSGLLQFVAE
ncbi:TPA: type I-E CRISPR-associated protein Cas7/Cse4/CasC [Proteus mirabilis]|uniref:type I-E CRISPR-associated protein Cas7/Cse4/CasC n=2 Tax=Proteus mirabilis TaxID=584 RepID=UPI000669241A|nr:type I-E CRISPR-associated protein Cas7/Cse4/CasC [Proteus mirabilis]ARA23254.1 type I-E CRISPR-associated protein Cas7/Cse4/CasC [Proteus mirabilis]EKV0740127.1 type I-E CRISPR-associated protein Cas7/Cse4/CasC [Proteus mirabilis]ELA7713123.1 type I-E CRISPR-associated protein Cas7/Cse4/CasC [Proteus mirabilis]ELA9917496.1 type I-E CRISPR-associated protein Cas7/Cse4/CasC [Proteus mirabilis]ELB1215343.1 type I-E CRISPR-associated protein Cas7/Cse4/CasC [Proteus mirabilis]